VINKITENSCTRTHLDFVTIKLSTDNLTHHGQGTKPWLMTSDLSVCLEYTFSVLFANCFQGIGAMGYGMAMNIRKEIPNSSTLFITDVFRPSCEKFKAEFSSHGPIEILDSAREVAERALTIISIVPSANNVRQVYLDNEHGIIAAKASPDRLMLECSTIDVETARDVGETLIKANAGLYIDTPVSVCPVPIADQ
jgi:3-hydroxyisobutyrate dehydrogenase-like beta-hydroxyacid dehydrogenase